jgi:hypothetical protein
MLPKDPITVGKTWDQTLDLGKPLGPMIGDQGLKAPLSIHYKVKSFGTYKGRKAVTLEMAIKGEISMDIRSSQGDPAPKMGLNLDGLGDIIVDQLTGLTLSSNTKLTMNLSMGGVQNSGADKIKQNIRVASEILDLASL